MNVLGVKSASARMILLTVLVLAGFLAAPPTWSQEPALRKPSEIACKNPVETPRLVQAAAEVFGSERAGRLFLVNNAVVGGPIPAPRCQCATDPGSTCPSGTFCDDTELCGVTRSGCGPGGVYACNGMCV